MPSRNGIGVLRADNQLHVVVNQKISSYSPVCATIRALVPRGVHPVFVIHNRIEYIPRIQAIPRIKLDSLGTEHQSSWEAADDASPKFGILYIADCCGDVHNLRPGFLRIL